MDAARVAHRTVSYLETPSVVGYERPFLHRLAAELDELGRTVEARDGLLAAPGASGPTLSAHIDRHGLVVTGPRRLAYAARLLAGEHRQLAPRLAAAICQRFQDERVRAYDPESGAVLGEGLVVHGHHCRQGPEVDLEVPEFDGFAPDTPVAFGPPVGLDDGWLRGQLDNALSAAIVLEAVAAGFGGTVLFTCGEEAGRSWEALADWFDHPYAELLVLDTSPFVDGEPAASGAVVLRRADANARFDRVTTSAVADAARRARVHVIWKDAVLAAAERPLGRTELGRLMAATGGTVGGTTIQIPTTDYHSSYEATTVAAIESTLAVLDAYLDRIAPPPP